jgi:hypothetical protein
MTKCAACLLTVALVSKTSTPVRAQEPPPPAAAPTQPGAVTASPSTATTTDNTTAAKRPINTRVPRNATLFIEGEETVDASNSKNKASYGDFSVAIAAALAKKKVPVLVVTDATHADFLVRHTSSAREDSTGTKVAKMVVLGGLWGSKDFNASMMVIDKATTAVLFSYNVKKGNFQSAAESFAKHLNGHIQGSE